MDSGQRKTPVGFGSGLGILGRTRPPGEAWHVRMGKTRSTPIGFVGRFAAVDDSAAWPELRGVDACATVTCEDVVVPVTCARAATLGPSRFVN